MNWENQITAMLESSYIDSETMADFGVAYAAETGDYSFIRESVYHLILTQLGSRPLMVRFSRSVACADRNEPWALSFSMCWDDDYEICSTSDSIRARKTESASQTSSRPRSRSWSNSRLLTTEWEPFLDGVV